MSHADTPRALPPSLPPELQAEFALESVLGQGGMGIVFAARERATGRAVAIKLVLGELSDLRRGRFEREGQITASLRHPNVVGVHRAGMAGGVPYLVYELVEGARELQDALPTLDLHDQVDLVRQSAEAVGYAHAQGVLHRDLKPANILVDAAGRVRVADFGLARATQDDRLTRTGVMIGTPAYMAPELARGESEQAGPPCDVWSLGVVLYEALADEHPFPAQTLFQLLDLIQQPVKPLSRVAPQLPHELSRICARALQLDPARRYPDAGALAADLAAFLEDPARDRRSGGKVAFVLLGGFATLALGALTALGLQAEPPPRPLATPSPELAVSTPSLTPKPQLPGGLVPSASTPGLFESRREGSELIRFDPPSGRGLRPFLFARKQVTRGQFARFCRDANQKPPKGFDPQQPVARPAAPMRGVSWEQAAGYAAFAGLRLPREEEWEFAIPRGEALGVSLALRDWTTRPHEGKPRLPVRGDPRYPRDASPRLVLSKDEGREDLGFRVACSLEPSSELRWRARDAGEVPGRAFFGATAVLGREKGILWFGGYAGRGLNDTWFCPSEGAPRQLRDGPQPSQRADFSLTWDAARGVAILQGGNPVGKGNPLYDDTWEWREGRWRELELDRLESCGARGWHSAAYDAAREEIVLFGGKRGDSSLDRAWSDTWTWDGASWRSRTGPQGPPPRSSHAMAYDARREVVVMFGGGVGRNYLGDTWEWDGKDWRRPNLRHSPSPRYRPALAYWPAREAIVLFGGHDGKSALDDLWLYRGDEAWTQIEVSDLRPFPRKACGFAVDPGSGNPLLVAGTSSWMKGYYTNELWELLPR